jgi:hypothetical protein
MRLTVSRILLLACALFAVVPATAGAATAPKVTKVTPLTLKIGQRLTIRGKGFIPGKNRNTVVFKARGGRAVFAKAQTATATKLVVKVPAKLAPFLTVAAGASQPTRFQLRVLARKLSPTYTPTGASPMISPAGGTAVATPAKPVTTTPAAKAPVTAPASAAAPATPAAPAPVPSTPVVVVADCDHDGIPNGTDSDDDNDLLPNGTENLIGTDRCNSDTDGDGVSDAFEYESALDLNGRSLDIPVGAPFPEPTYTDDVNYDFDGDGLTMAEEYKLWLRMGGTLPLQYSDGDQDSTGTGDPADITDAALTDPTLDRDNNGELTDDEKDFDADKLTNWEERHGPMVIDWWVGKYPKETSFAFKPGAAPLGQTDWLVRDTDRDGRPDGDDDQDHDGWTNLDELSRDGGFWVNEYNPCLPDMDSRACTLHEPLANPWAPFDGSNPQVFDANDILLAP